MKRLYFLLTALVVLAACNKNDKEIIEDPKPEAAFTRTVVYTNQNNSQRSASYSGNVTVDARAGFDGNQIFVGMSVMPVTPGTTGDAIWFRIDKSLLQQGLQNTYSIDGQTTPAVQNTRYLHMVEKQEGGFWSSIHETSMGLKMEGSLTITQYNAERKLLSGYFNVRIKDLTSDPLNYNRTTPVDPLNLNTVTVTGTFSNVKLATE